MKAKVTKARRIRGLMVHEVSLVDSPAVPKAKFLLAKRADEEDEEKQFPDPNEPDEMDEETDEEAEEETEDTEEEQEPEPPAPKPTISDDEIEAMTAMRAHLSEMETLVLTLPPELADLIDEFGNKVRAEMRTLRARIQTVEETPRRDPEEMAALEEAARQGVAEASPLDAQEE